MAQRGGLRVAKDPHAPGAAPLARADAPAEEELAASLLEEAGEPFPWDRLTPRDVSPDQWERFQGYVAEIFEAFGMDLDTPGTRRTPERFLQAVYEATSGYEGDPNLLTAFPTECGDGSPCALSQVIEGPIQFYALCEHHALPFFGVAYVGYVPGELIIGISKLTRLVRLFAQRFAVQERLGRQIADGLEAMLQPHGVAVYLEAHHMCMQMRGVREVSSLTRTTFWRGEYDQNPALRAEFLSICGVPS
jgi:GTP cyclohydrolase I